MGRTVTNTTAEDERYFLLLDALMGAGRENPSAAIERQEARGQRELVESDTLPTKGLEAVADALGIKVGAVVEGDPMFTYVTLPEGVTKVGTDHSMWSELRGPDGEKLASMFYKAAFYDRSAHIHLETYCAACPHSSERHPYIEYERPQPCVKCDCTNYQRS